MAHVHRLPDVREAEREASAWVARLNADDASADDRARFEAWRDAHPVHSRVYAELADTWRQFTAAGPLVRAVSFAQSMNEVAEVRRPRPRWDLVVATVTAIAILLGGLLYVEWFGSETKFRTAIGEQATILLPDGSTMELNSNSLARVEYSARSRVIHLERGEGFFTVAHDIHRPFWVIGDGSWVRAVGTAFNVYESAGGVLVTVSEGVVKAGSAGSLRGAMPSDDILPDIPVSVLTAGQQADFHGTTTSTRRLTSGELAETAAWRSGVLYFENRPLSDVVDELARYTTLHIVVDDKLRHLLVGGTFQASPRGAEALLSMLQQGFGVSVRREGDYAYVLIEPTWHPQVGDR